MSMIEGWNEKLLVVPDDANPILERFILDIDQLWGTQNSNSITYPNTWSSHTWSVPPCHYPDHHHMITDRSTSFHNLLCIHFNVIQWPLVSSMGQRTINAVFALKRFPQHLLLSTSHGPHPKEFKDLSDRVCNIKLRHDLKKQKTSACNALSTMNRWFLILTKSRLSSRPSSTTSSSHSRTEGSLRGRMSKLTSRIFIHSSAMLLRALNHL